MKTINVLGCGRVGKTLAALLARHEVCQLQDLYSRQTQTAQEAARFIGAGAAVANLCEMRAADLWMLSVPDAQVPSVAAELAAVAQSRPDMKPAVVFHCSGFLAASALSPLQALGWRTASVHPVFNFADPHRSVSQFKGTPCGLEGDPQATALLQDVMTKIGGACFGVSSDAKPIYHAAAVFSSNFMAVLQAIAREGWRHAGVADDAISRIHASLLRGSVDNLLALGPEKAITGPAARGDEAVVSLQGEWVGQWHPEAGELYRLMSVMARRLATTGSTALPSKSDAP